MFPTEMFTNNRKHNKNPGITNHCYATVQDLFPSIIIFFLTDIFTRYGPTGRKKKVPQPLLLSLCEKQLKAN